MAEKPGEAPKRRFSEKKYVLPFGRYVGSPEAEPPADEVLVGREGQRAYLIDLLISSGRRGAYLVTGHRGAGKTSFVKYCISEYEASVFSRFLRGNVGRGVWDRVFVFLFWMAILVVALLATELVQFLVNSPAKGGDDLLQWVVLLPIGIILLYPCVYAKVVLETCIRASARKAGMAGITTNGQGVEKDVSRWAGGAAFLIVLGLSIAIWIAPYSGRPAVAISLLITLVCALYATVQADSFQREGDFKKTLAYRTYFFVAVVLLGVLYESFSILNLLYSRFVPQIHENAVTENVFRFHLALSLIFLGLGSVLKSVDQRERAGLTDSTRASVLRDAITWGSRWYFLFGYAALLCGSLMLGYVLRRETLWIYVSLFILPASLVGVFLFVRGRASKKASQQRTKGVGATWFFQPRPTWILIAKAIVAIVVALQLAHPILSFLFYRSAAPFFSYLGCQPKSLCSAFMSQWTPFVSRSQENLWLEALLILIVLFHFVEYEWIIRPYVKSREERAFGAGGLAPWDERGPEAGPEEKRLVLHSLAELTLPWATYKTWLPVLTIAVNLGLLDHRHVIQAMLLGLRKSYHRAFLAWNSGLANIGRFLGFFAVVILTLAISRLIPVPVHIQKPANEHYKIYFQVSDVPSLNSAPDKLGLSGKIWFIATKGYAAFSVPAGSSDRLLCDLMPHWSDSGDTTIFLGAYHVVLFSLLFLLGHLIVNKMGLLPYRLNLRNIDNLLESLSTRTKITSRLNLWGPVRSVYNMFSDERLRETERGPVDPRTVDLDFLQVLDDVQKGGFYFSRSTRHHLTMPAPEITFILDELDKLGAWAGTMGETQNPATPRNDTQIVHNELERSLRLRALLSDLKNIMTSAAARFIFVGGRDLHDEWLADQNSRAPLLTSIFKAEVYLPSLLTDQRLPPRDANPLRPRFVPSLHERIVEYLSSQYQRALFLYKRSARKRWLPSFGLPEETIAPERFAFRGRIADFPAVLDSGTGDPVNEIDRESLLNDFVLFLTYRSMGNPKKLGDLLSGFIRPAGREFDTNMVRWFGTPYDHIIRLGDIEIFRIQLLVTIYRHLAQAFESRMIKRDDKYAISVFFLTDFLFKFHSRAFSWSDLERLGDLAHVHRLPDLRKIQEEIVDHFSGVFLNSVTNGIYSFRFRSDLAREIEYLSRRSPAEMVAFNFTLDESLSLKNEYMAALEGSELNNPDLIAALGHLYEFDHDFERARFQYRVAIKILDKDLALMGVRLEDYPIAEILDGKEEGHARIFLSWTIARLRLMLRIGMTFELERDLRQAEAEYRGARNLCGALVQGYLDLRGENAEIFEDWRKLETWKSQARGRKGGLHNIKNMDIIFQPMFSEAWIEEKIVDSIDGSILLIERELREVRQTLPFVRDPETEVSYDTDSYASFSLTTSRLHAKTGHLYFFKGRQPVTTSQIRTLACSSYITWDGYLPRALYHYAVSLHDLRRYIHRRVSNSKDLLSVKEPKSPTLVAEALPDFLYQSAAVSVSSLAEATLARISLFSVFRQILDTEYIPRVSGWCSMACLEWLGTDDSGIRGSILRSWFGEWVNHSSYDENRAMLIEFTGPDTASEQLLMSLNFSCVGAHFLEAGGYPEDAGRELLQVCEAVTRYLWWGLAVEWLGAAPGSSGGEGYVWWGGLSTHIEGWQKKVDEGEALAMSGLFTNSEFWRELVNLGIEVLDKAEILFRQSRYSVRSEVQRTREGRPYLVGWIIPAEALTLLCSLRLGAMAVPLILDYESKRRIDNLAQRWRGTEGTSYGIEDFSNILELSMQRHAYPMINRLKGMKVLIDNLVLKSRSEGDPDAQEEVDFQQALEWTLELLNLNEQFDAPLHFTPSHSGMTCALVWLWGAQRFASKENRDVLDRIHRAAQRDLANSEEMYTMGRSYYEAISGLYYLYDDFNDRQIHFNHAIQMAGAELNAILKFLVDEADELRRKPAPRPE